MDRYPLFPPDKSLEGRLGAYWFLCFNQELSRNKTIDWLNGEYLRLEGYLMAKKQKSSENSNQLKAATWEGYANVQLEEADKAAIRNMTLSPDEFWDKLAELISTGHKITHTSTPDRNGVMTTVTGAYSNSPNAGYSMTSQGKDIVQSLYVTIYKHFILSGGVWGGKTKPDMDDVMR